MTIKSFYTEYKGKIHPIIHLISGNYVLDLLTILSFLLF